MDFYEALMEYPIIGAIETSTDVSNAPCSIFFILGGELSELEFQIKNIIALKKQVYVHMDLIQGIKADEAGLRFVKSLGPHGIITTHSRLISKAKELDLFAIQRLFLLDRKNLKSGIKSVKKSKPDAIEVLPGVVYKATKELMDETNIPIISGGLMMDKEDVIGSLKVGAIGVSTSLKELWTL